MEDSVVITDGQDRIDAAREARLRRRAARLGYSLRKSRVRNPHMDDIGGYRLIITNMNAIFRGERFELDLDDVEAILNDCEED